MNDHEAMISHLFFKLMFQYVSLFYLHVFIVGWTEIEGATEGNMGRTKKKREHLPPRLCGGAVFLICDLECHHWAAIKK